MPKTKSPQAAIASAIDANEIKVASRSSIIAALGLYETYTVSEYLEPDVRAEHIQEVMATMRKVMSERLSSTLRFCQKKTGNVYSRETQCSMTNSGRFVVSLIIERTA